MEECDDGNEEDTDSCVACDDAFCGDGFVYEGQEECDDGNNVDDDACTNGCISNLVPLGDIQLGGTAYGNIDTALNTIGEPYQVMNTQWLTPNAADILIMSNDGGNANAPDYTAHLDSGKHVLIIGGGGLRAYRDWVANHFAVGASFNWHQASDCQDDWNKGPNHPMTSLLDDTYEFPDQAASYHVLHFNDAGQPGSTSLLGNTCHRGPDNHMLITREYANNGSLTYVALDIGQYADGQMQDDFVVPFLEGYFSWLQMGAP